MLETSNRNDEPIRSSKEYIEGVQAFNAGKDSFNPYDYYVDAKKHNDWKDGYWDTAKIAEKSWRTR